MKAVNHGETIGDETHTHTHTRKAINGVMRMDVDKKQNKNKAPVITQTHNDTDNNVRLETAGQGDRKMGEICYE